MTIRDAAAVTGIPSGTIRRWLATGVIQSITGRKPHTVNVFAKAFLTRNPK